MVEIFITNNRNVVTVRGKYPAEVSRAHEILGQFKTVQPGSTWGLDGVAEYVAAKNGEFSLNKSGISKKQALQWIKEGRADLIV